MTTDDDRRELIGRLLGPQGAEVSCEECFELLDVYVDLERHAAAMLARE